MKRSSSLKFTIPIILVTIVILYLSVSWVIVKKVSRDSIIDIAQHKNIELAHKIAHDVEVVLKLSHNPFDINDILTNYLLGDVNYIAVYDDNNDLIYKSSSYSNEKNRESFLKEFYAPTLKDYNLKQKYIEEDTMILAMVPFVFPAEGAEILSDRFGRVYFEYNLDRDIRIMQSSSNRLLVIYILGNIILIAVIMYFLYRKIINRIMALSRGTQAITKGYYDFRLEYKEDNDGDELDHLFLSFNHMADSLSDKEDKVKIAYEALMLKTQEANRANNAKSEFLANMSHEIRTPLNAMLGFIQVLQKKEEDIERLRFFNIINESSNNLLGIINDILDFSKIESGKLDIDLHDFDAHNEFKTIFELYRHKADEKSIEFTYKVDARMPKVLCSDPLRLKQVIANLLSNAVKFSKKHGHIEMHIFYDTKKHELRVDIKDDGIGIEAEKQKNIFTPFTQSDSSITRKYGGTGLGLSISHQLIELLGGKLTFKSKYNEGSTFSFHVPVKIGNAIGLEAEEGIVTFSQQKILLVEDNVSSQMLMSILLDEFNLDYEIANDGQEAVEKFQKNIFDVILMDENMPKMNGIEAAKQMRIIERETHAIATPIVALTANALKGDRERFLEAGMDEYLSKPIDKLKLQTVLKHFIFLKENSLNTISTLSVADIKKESLAVLFGLTQEDVGELLDIFYENAKKRIKELQKAIMIGDYALMAKSAHAIGGSASNLRLDQIAKSADIIEHSARKEEDIDYTWYYEQLDLAIERFR